MTPWGLANCKVFGPQGPSLTNRVSELFTHGSVGGVGRKPGPYPAEGAEERRGEEPFLSSFSASLCTAIDQFDRSLRATSQTKGTAEYAEYGMG